MAPVSLRAFGFDTAFQDLRHAARQFRKSPGFAATSILILALGIGACTAIFSAVNPILFEPLPYPKASQLVMLWEDRGGSRVETNFATYHGLVERSQSFDALALMKPWQPAMSGPTQPERFEGQRVSAAYFRVLGVAPHLGRDFTDADDQYRGPNVVILSDHLWHRRFDGNRGIIGRQITLDDNSFTVIGVMPAGFDNVLAPAAELWAPLQYDPALLPWTREWGHHLRMVGRLRAGVSRARAASELRTIMHTLAQLYAAGYAQSGGPAPGFIVDSLQDEVTRAVKPALLAVMAAVILLLLIASVNVTNLLLARGAQRRGEFAMRVALGAPRTRLIRQLLTESVLLALMGGTLGLILADFGLQTLLALSPAGMPRLSAIRLDGTVFIFALVATTVIGVAVGLIPALHASRGDLQPGIQQSSQRTAGGHQFTRRALVVAEVALALVLLVSTGLLLRSLRHLFAISPGFDASHLLTMQIQEAGHRYDPDPARLRFFDQALEAVRAVPGVVSAGFTSQLPLSGDLEVYGAEFEGDREGQGQGVLRYAVTPGYVETMRIPLLRGRLLNAHDTANSPRVVLINESLAKRKFAVQDPLGKRVCVRCDVGPNRPWSTIVGVVGDVRQVSLELTDNDAVYMPNSQWYWADNMMSLVARTRGDAAALAPSIERAIWSIDKDQPIIRIVTMERLLVQSQAERRFALIVFEAFGIAALALAAVGIYGVLAGGVAERMREIGVRSALGASSSNILALVIRQGMTLVGVGVAIGLVGAVAATPILSALLFGISRLDAVTYLGVILILAAASAVACWVPAWRASQIDPSITLRAE